MLPHVATHAGVDLRALARDRLIGCIMIFVPSIDKGREYFNIG